MMRTSSFVWVTVSLILLTGCKDGQNASRAVQPDNNRGAAQSGSELPRIPVARSTPQCPDTTGELPRSYRGVCLDWTLAQMQRADPQIQCAGDVCWPDPPPSGIKEIVYTMRTDRLGRISVSFTADALADGFDAVLDRAKHEYGSPVAEKVPLTSTLKLGAGPRDDVFERTLDEAALYMASGAHVTTWKDNRTEITLLYIPGKPINVLTGRPDVNVARPSVGLILVDLAFKQQKDEEQRHAEEREQQERGRMFSK